MFVLFKKKEERSDKECVALFKQTGDQRYFTPLFNKYSHLVYGSCFKYLENEEDAKDAVLEIFEKLRTDLQKSNIEHFSSWLFMVTKNHCLMKLRKAKTREQHLDTISLETGRFMENGLEVHPNTENEQEALLQQMERCLKTLVEKQKICVELFYLERLNYAEVARKAGFDINQVKSFIQNGKRNLKLCIEAGIKAA
ncbi:MAG: sigma-70 family RNA polymerase sigma factor [Bacteroidia bacterium]|nr:sigma-70 family RNA polymerase sigma factor [Bacteroidia bacterium]